MSRKLAKILMSVTEVTAYGFQTSDSVIGDASQVSRFGTLGSLQVISVGTRIVMAWQKLAFSLKESIV